MVLKGAASLLDDLEKNRDKVKAKREFLEEAKACWMLLDDIEAERVTVDEARRRLSQIQKEAK